jgi:para-aminobenzoate synthetase/4-amino-4-deoxychorismate lyase
MPAAPHCDPERGVFETLLVVEGRPIELDAHLARLEASLRALFGSPLRDDARQIALDRVRGLALARLRLVAAPVEGGAIGVELSVESLDQQRAFPAQRCSVALSSLIVEGGFGAHKWLDRGLLERAEAELPERAAPLLVDRDGTVLEASRANVFAVHDGVLVTPPTDGRIVPGITRRRVLELARAAGRETREKHFTVPDLLAADEVFLTNSVRGIEPVHSIHADVPRPDGLHRYSTHGTSLERSEGGVSGEIAAGLRASWLGEAAPAGSAAAVP